jgi:hypothetical protein
VLPPSLQSSLPAGWLAFTGRELNPLDRYKRFQITTLVPLFWICPGAREVSWRLSLNDATLHSALMLAARITLAHISISAAMRVANSCGVLATRS